MIRVVIGLIGNIILCFHGVRSLLINEPIFSLPFVSYLFATGGLIGIIALTLELTKKDAT
jgi:hypothetical protein